MWHAMTRPPSTTTFTYCNQRVLHIHLVSRGPPPSAMLTSTGEDVSAMTVLYVIDMGDQLTR